MMMMMIEITAYIPIYVVYFVVTAAYNVKTHDCNYGLNSRPNKES